MTKSQAGRLGGTSTFKKYGHDHMKTIGLNGAKSTWSRYSLKPVGAGNYAMVSRADNTIKAFINSANFNWRM